MGNLGCPHCYSRDMIFSQLTDDGSGVFTCKWYPEHRFTLDQEGYPRTVKETAKQSNFNVEKAFY